MNCLYVATALASFMTLMLLLGIVRPVIVVIVIISTGFHVSFIEYRFATPLVFIVFTPFLFWWEVTPSLLAYKGFFSAKLPVCYSSNEG